MELRHLRYFVSLADALHFTRAAELLNVTQSTLSHQIRQLEEELGTQLFHRTARAIQLSTAGSLFLTYAKRILREADSAVTAVNDLDSLRRGTIKIAVIHTLVRAVVVPALGRFVTRHPLIQISIEEATTSRIEAALVDGSIDFGIAVAPHRCSELASEVLFEEDYLVALGAHHPLASAKALLIEELRDVPLVLLTQAFATRRLVDHCFETARVTQRVMVECASIEAVFDLVDSTNLATIMPATALRAHPGLHRIPFAGLVPRRACALFWARDVSRSKAATVLIEAIREQLDGDDLTQ